MTKKLSMAAVIRILKDLALAHPSRDGFVNALRAVYTQLGCGAFRVVFNIGGWAVKIRRPSPSSDFEQHECDSANSDEYEAYKLLKRKYPSLAALVLAPKYVHLLPAHDAIIMPRVRVAATAERRLEDFTFKPFTSFMQEQYNLIREAFVDAHLNNVGFDKKLDRVWLIDFNLSCDWYTEKEVAKADKIFKKIA